MHHPDNGQRSYKPQTKYAERMILPGSSQKYSRTYLWVRGSWGTDCRKRQISSSSFFFLSSFSYKTCRTCILKTLTCHAEVFCWWYMQIMEPLQSLQAWSTWLSCSSLMNTPPPSPLRWWWVVEHDTNTVYWMHILLSMETERSTKDCCWREYVLVQVHHLVSFLGVVIKKPNTRTPG